MEARLANTALIAIAAAAILAAWTRAPKAPEPAEAIPAEGAIEVLWSYDITAEEGVDFGAAAEPIAGDPPASVASRPPRAEPRASRESGILPLLTREMSRPAPIRSAFERFLNG